jgi:hypothetical protein
LELLLLGGRVVAGSDPANPSLNSL